MNCPKCGYDVGEHKFCPECGTKIDEMIQSEAKEKAKEKTDSMVTASSNTKPDRQESENAKQNEVSFAKRLSNHKKYFFVVVALIAVVVLIVVFTHKSDEVKSCIAYIDSLPDEINLYSDTVISLAEKSYNDLSKSDKRKVNNHKELVEARDKFNKLKADFIELEIDKLSEKSELYQIQNTRKLYDNLTDAQKGLVENYSELQSYEESYYDDMISEAIEKINKITYISGTATSQDETEINEAQDAYDRIDDNYKNKVTNYSKLEDATTNLKAFYMENAQKLINESLEKGTGFSVAENAYNKLDDKQKKEINNYDEFSKKYEAYKNKSPIKIISYRLESNSIGNPEIIIKAKNESDQIVKSYTVAIFAYDKEGVPVSLGFNSYIKTLNYDHSIKPGETTPGNIYWTFYGMYDKNSMKNVVAVVKEVSFFDESVWENPSYGALCEKYEQQIISTNDANIIPKG